MAGAPGPHTRFMDEHEAAREARALVARTSAAALGTLTAAGDPWVSLVACAALPDGAPVLMVSSLAEHGRNLVADPRASLMIAGAPGPEGDPLAGPRVTLLGRAERPVGDRLAAARAAYLAAVPGARAYSEFGDFTVWVLRVERIRWVAGFGRMASAGATAYANAAP